MGIRTNKGKEKRNMGNERRSSDTMFHRGIQKDWTIDFLYDIMGYVYDSSLYDREGNRMPKKAAAIAGSVVNPSLVPIDFDSYFECESCMCKGNVRSKLRHYVSKVGYMAQCTTCGIKKVVRKHAEVNS